jgi:putative transposase
VLTEHGIQIAPRTFYAWASRAPSKRALWDAAITEILAGFYEPDEHGRRPPESLYGSVKMWAHLQRQGFPVAKSTVERLMRGNGWQGVRRQKSVRTTISDPAAERAPGLVDRQFRVPTPNALVVADFTYVKLVTGVFVYVAFVIDAYAGAIIGWEAASAKLTRFVESAIRQAAALRARQGHRIDGAIPHSGAGSPYTAIHFGETLSLSGLRPSMAASAMPTTTPWPRRPSGSTRTNASGPIHRSAAARYATSPTSSSSPPTTSLGTTSSASCTASDASHPPKQKPNTTIK